MYRYKFCANINILVDLYAREFNINTIKKEKMLLLQQNKFSKLAFLSVYSKDDFRQKLLLSGHRILHIEDMFPYRLIGQTLLQLMPA